MATGNKYFVCGLPYQIAVKEGLYDKAQAEDEMTEGDFDPVAWSMEMDAMFYGENDKAFFKHTDIMEVRDIQIPTYTKEIYDSINLNRIKYVKPSASEITILSCDIAVAEGNENDNSVYTILRLIPNSKGYERRVVYIETINGGHTVTQANRIRQLFFDFHCNYVVLDTKGVGFGVYDQLILNSFDQERGIEYNAWTCINDEKMADRCKVSNAEPVIYSIKATSEINSAIAFSLRDNIKRKKLKLLLDENKARQNLLSIKGYGKLSIEEQVKLEVPFKQTSALVNEMINLETVIVGNTITLKESGSMRKDRYSSLAYGNYFADILEAELMASQNSNSSEWNEFVGLW